MANKHCPDCGAAPGEEHGDDCDVERCPFCGGQLLSCGCFDNFLRDQPGVYEKWLAHLDAKGRLPWTGEWPGKAECRKFGFFVTRSSVENPRGRGFVRCDADHPDATENLNRLYTDCEWDPEKKEFVLRKDRS